MLFAYSFIKPPKGEGGGGGNERRRTVDCNSSTRQFVKLMDSAAQGAGVGALVLGALGAEPAAAALTLGAGAAEILSVGGGAYIYFSEGDAGPLKGTVIGLAASKLSSFSFKIQFPGASNTYRANRERVVDQVISRAPNTGTCQ